MTNEELRTLLVGQAMAAANRKISLAKLSSVQKNQSNGREMNKQGMITIDAMEDEIDRVRNEEAAKWLAQESRILELEAQLAERWISVDAPIAPPEGAPLILYHADWVCPDFNPNGQRDGFYCGGEWICAYWHDYQDVYTESDDVPSHWRRYPSPPQGKE